MTQYEHLQSEHSNLRTKQIIARAVPAIFTATVFTIYMTEVPIISATSFFMGLAIFLAVLFSTTTRSTLYFAPTEDGLIVRIK
jgi:hypothetical protein